MINKYFKKIIRILFSAKVLCLIGQPNVLTSVYVFIHSFIQERERLRKVNAMKQNGRNMLEQDCK